MSESSEIEVQTNSIVTSRNPLSEEMKDQEGETINQKVTIIEPDLLKVEKKTKDEGKQNED